MGKENERLWREACAADDERARLVVEFAFGLGADVRISGSSVTGTVLGRMHDCNGLHYEVDFIEAGKPVRKWFDQSHLGPV